MDIGRNKIGLGYSTDKQRVLEKKCLDFDESALSFTGSPQSILTFNGVSSYTETATELGVDVSIHAKIDLGVTSLDVDAAEHFTRYVKETEYSKSYIFNVNALLPSVKLNITKYGLGNLSEEAAVLYKSSPEKFREVCGDKFILQAALGASLYISTKLEFATRTERYTFSVDGSGLIGTVMDFLKLSGDGINLFFKNERASLSIAVLQKGGDIRILSNLVPELNLTEQGLATIDCLKNGGGSIEERIKECQRIMAKVLDYASSDFAKSVKDEKSEKYNQFSAALDTYNISYEAIGINGASSAVTPKIAAIRLNLKSKYEQLSAQQLFLEKLLQDRPIDKKYIDIDGVKVGWDYNWIPSDILRELRELNNIKISKISALKKQIENAAKLCYDEIKACRDVTDSIDDSIIKALQESYIIRSECSSNNVTDSRYILPIGQGIYKEDSVLTIAGKEQHITAIYQITMGLKNITVMLNGNQSCVQALKQDEQYNLVHVYRGSFIGDCGKMLCPDGMEVSIEVPVELILTETPI